MMTQVLASTTYCCPGVDGLFLSSGAAFVTLFLAAFISLSRRAAFATFLSSKRYACASPLFTLDWTHCGRARASVATTIASSFHFVAPLRESLQKH